MGNKTNLALAGGVGALVGNGVATSSLGTIGASVSSILAGAKGLSTAFALGNPFLAGAAALGGIGYAGKRVLWDWLIQQKMRGGGHGAPAAAHH